MTEEVKKAATESVSPPAEEVINLSLTPVERKYEIDGEVYTLREATGTAAMDYQNAILKCTRFGPNGKPIGFSNLANTEPMLVASCLVNSKGLKVGYNTIVGWPSRILTALYKKAKEISELDTPEVNLLHDVEDLEAGLKIAKPTDRREAIEALEKMLVRLSDEEASEDSPL